MGAAMPVRLTAENSAELCRRVELSDGARLLAREGQTPRELLTLLIEGRHDLDAVRMLAHAMPKREAVWWAVSCARVAHGPEPTEAAAAAMDAAERWISDPTDEHRRAAMPAAELAGLGTPAGCACASVFFTGGSLAPVGVPDVPPGEFVTSQLIAAAVAMSAVFKEPQLAAEKYRDALALGRRIIDGEATPPPPKGTITEAQPTRSALAEAASSASPAPEQPKRPSLFF